MNSLEFLGAAREVTGSCHLLTVGDRKILLDCGMHQGGSGTDRLTRERFAFNPMEIDAVVLSHAHLDHSGLLPRLVNQGFGGQIYCTHGTKKLLKILLEDSAGIYFRDLEYDNIQRRRAGKTPTKALYTDRDVAEVIRRCQPIAYYHATEILPWLTLRFLDAGHILGSAIVELVLEQNGDQQVIVFSGDLGNPETSLMRHYDYVDKANVVLLESTYGDRDHRPMDDTMEEFRGILRQAEADGGNILIPSFAVGRTQELLFHLGLFYQEGLLNNWHVYLDSPMGNAVTQVYSQSMGMLNQEDLDQLSGNGNGMNGLRSALPNLTVTESVDDSIAINRIDKGAIIIAGSGMCTGGRIRHHFKHRLWDPKNHVVFVGFQAEGTLGRLLVNGVEKVKLFHQWIAVKAKMHTLGGFSAHAGRTALLDWAERLDDNAAFYLVHGEPGSMDSLAEALRNKGRKVLTPDKQQRVEF